MAMYKRSRGIEPGTTWNKSRQWSELDLNSGSPDFESAALTTRLLMTGIHSSEQDDNCSTLGGLGVPDIQQIVHSRFYMIRRILNLILTFTASQFRLSNIGLIRSELRAPVVILYIFCFWFYYFFCRPSISSLTSHMFFKQVNSHFSIASKQLSI